MLHNLYNHWCSQNSTTKGISLRHVRGFTTCTTTQKDPLGLWGSGCLVLCISATPPCKGSIIFSTISIALSLSLSNGMRPMVEERTRAHAIRKRERERERSTFADRSHPYINELKWTSIFLGYIIFLIVSSWNSLGLLERYSYRRLFVNCN